MTPAFEALQNELKRLPGLGYRSAERIALTLLVEKPESAQKLLDALRSAIDKVGSCPVCGNVSEGGLCPVCEDSKRANGQLCIVEHVPDLVALERAGAWQGRYHVLHGRLSPLKGVGPDDLNLKRLKQRLIDEDITEVMLALSNDIEGEATCHFLKEEFFQSDQLNVLRIGFGLPSGGNLTFADSVTLKSALASRRRYD